MTNITTPVNSFLVGLCVWRVGVRKRSEADLAVCFLSVLGFWSGWAVWTLPPSFCCFLSFFPLSPFPFWLPPVFP